LAFYDDKKPDPDPFEQFLDIPHHGRLAESDYTKADEATTLLYEYIPADSAIDSLFPPGAGEYSPPSSESGVMNKYVAAEMV
jgi:hypothetical protein